MASGKPLDSLLFFLDSTAIANGANLPASQCRTTPGVLSEFQGAGATSRRLDQFLAAGMLVLEPSPEALSRAAQAAHAAGLDARLSRTDIEIAAAAADGGSTACLVTDDYTIQDLARRLGIRAQGVATDGITEGREWELACRGCGRRYPTDFKREECPVCGAALRPKTRPTKPR